MTHQSPKSIRFGNNGQVVPMASVKIGKKSIAPNTDPTPGIYHSPSNGLISLSSDGEHWLTIADKNLGATQVYNVGDTLSQTNCGGYFQRGNNYMFPFTGATNTSSSQVDTTGYGPGNYYSSNVFFITDDVEVIWTLNRDRNLRGGETGTYEAMQGPCPNGFHVPSRDDIITLCQIIRSFGFNDSLDVKTYLKMPLAGRLEYDTGNPTNVDGVDWLRIYRGSWAGSTALWLREYAIFSALPQYWSTSQNGGTSYCNGAGSLRPFKNKSVTPTSSWTKLY